jgi:ABC-2 type transport system ATP-binding protein
VGLAQAIVHEPQVLILDEPTVGIDPIQVAQTRELIRDLAREHTILLSTHILSEVSMLCERVIIIHRGRIVAQDRIGNLSALLRSGSRIRLRVQGPADEVTRSLRGIDGVRDVEYREPHHVVAFPSDREPRAQITESLVRSGWTLLSMETVEMSLEEIFLEVTVGEKKQP